MVITTRGIVFSAIKYGEADLIVNCFTESSGLKSYLLRNVLKSRKGKLRASYFQSLTQLEMTVVHRDKGTLERIKEVKVSNHYKTLHTDVVKSAVVMFLAEVLKSAIQEEEANQGMFEYIKASLDWLDEHEDIANFHILFLLRLTAYLGFYPDDSNTGYDWFNLEEGTFEPGPSGNSCEEGVVVQDFKQFLGTNFDSINTIKLTKERRSAVLHLLLLYYQLHLQGYKKPRSLPVLNQLFN